MIDRPKIVLAMKGQWGYQTDYNMYAKYLAEDFRVKVLAVDLGLEKVQMGQEVVSYTSRSSVSKIARTWRLLQAIWNELSMDNQVLCKYFAGISVLSIHPRFRNLVLDFRTVSVSKGRIRRYIEDLMAAMEARCFARINVVHSSVAEKYKIANATVVPLGAEEVPRIDVKKSDSGKSVKFVYVGALAGRNLEILLAALKLVSPKVKFELHIVGDGDGLSALVNLVQENKLNDLVEFHGRVSHGPELSRLISSCDWGVVHVPPTIYYSGQPSTKMFEYFAHGLPVLCSNYPAGVEFMNEQLGYIYDFNPYSLSLAIEAAAGKSRKFSVEEIIGYSKSFLWKNIVQSNLYPTLNL